MADVVIMPKKISGSGAGGPSRRAAAGLAGR